jgi:asparagine synthase (glutamine-hydrolysing)
MRGEPIPDLERRLEVMNALIGHRGPDDEGVWTHERGHVGLAHRRLAIIDPTPAGHQPMRDEAGRWLSFNGEIYNYPELRTEIGGGPFRTSSDTEVLMRAHDRWGDDALTRLRGMFAYALWDEPEDELFLARDRFGIKPLYYAVVDDVFYFASEAKALMPVLPSIETDHEGLKDYLAFQFCLAGKTLFEGVRELQPGHSLRIGRGPATPKRYWEVYYDVDFEHNEGYFEERIEELLDESVRFHLRSDVPVAAYLSGGVDSSAVASLAGRDQGGLKAFTGKFSEDPRFDESPYARIVAEQGGLDLTEVDVDVNDFLEQIENVAYHMDYPAAGPGSFPQYMVSRAAAQQVKVILGGQGGDEVFGGYTRYLIAYFEQCIKGAMDGTLRDGNFVVTYESIIPNLVSLRNYKPLMRDAWSQGLFDEDLDARYFRLINRARDVENEVDVAALGDYSPFETYREIFNGDNVGHEAYFDKMTHFDFKTLLPALLQVEDRVSMAHGLESRVPLLDHRLIELAATIPADVKFKDGHMKHVFKRATRKILPKQILERTDKMGFPVPLSDYLNDGAHEFVTDVLSSKAAKGRELIDNDKVLAGVATEKRFGRKLWGMLSLELWQRSFHDREREFRRMLDSGPLPSPVAEEQKGRASL